MTPLEVLRRTIDLDLTDEDGDSVSVELEPGMSEKEIAELEERLPCAIPAEVRELLAFCRGFTGGAADYVDFTGKEALFAYEEVFPHGHPIAADGLGNFWVVDLLPQSAEWAPIYFACHDAPVVLYQSPSLAHFLAELSNCSIPPHKSLVDDVHEDRLFNVWTKNPGVLSYEECAESPDAELKAFADALDPSFQVVDMRTPEIGFGFSWGRYGPKTVVKRHGLRPIFAYQKPKGFLQRLFG